MADILIRHTMEAGTILTGSSKGDGVWEIARGHGFTYRRSVGIFIMGSRDRPPRWGRINGLATALRDAGHAVEVDVETEMRDPEVREEALAERLADRQEALAAKADRLATQGQADYQRARQMADAIPFGQPMLTDHYSYKSDRNYRDRMHRTYDRAFETLNAAEEASRRAQASETNLAYRYDGPTIRRRLDKLAAEERRWIRDLDGRLEFEEVDGHWRPRIIKPTGNVLDWVLQHLAETQADIVFWRRQLQELEASGFKVWGPKDFAKGDQVRHRGDWRPVLRVNRRSLTVPHYFIDRLTMTIPYDRVDGRRPADHEELVGRPDGLAPVTDEPTGRPTPTLPDPEGVNR